MRSRRSLQAGAALPAVNAEGDRVRAFVTGLRDSIDVAALFFARYDQRGFQVEVVLDDNRAAHARQAAWLEEEYGAQNDYDALLPRVTDAAVDLDGMRGIVAVYGNTDSILGIAILVRNRPFEPAERELLEATLRPGSDLLRRLAAFDGDHTAKERTAERASPAQFVLSPSDFSVELKWIPRAELDDALVSILEFSDGLPPVIETAVREMTAGWTDDPASWTPGIAVPLPFMVVQVRPLDGPAGLRIGVLVERYRSRNPLRYAQEKYGMSAREVEVLALVLKGFGTPQVASLLDIAESTAHDHIKRMMLKTRSRNRVELAAKTLGWRGL